MFGRFTPGAQAVVELAQAEARSLRHGYIGTEHLLLGLPGEGDGIAARTLRAVGSSAESVRRNVQTLVGGSLLTGPDAEALVLTTSGKAAWWERFLGIPLIRSPHPGGGVEVAIMSLPWRRRPRPATSSGAVQPSPP